MDLLTKFGLEKSRFTVLLMLVILLLGFFSYLNLPKRENPAITIRTAAVVANFEGMSPERVEDLIAVPIERRIRDIDQVDDIRTIVTTGQVLIYTDLSSAISLDDIEDAWEDLRNKMEQVKAELPDGTQGPFVNTDYGDVAIATIAITGDGFDLAYLEEVARDFQKDLYSLAGIANVSLSGQQDERIWLELDTRKLAAVGVQINQVLEDLRAQNVILPAGELDAGGTNIALEANGDLRSIEEIENVLTKVSGLAGFVRLADLVNVRRGFVDPKEKPVFFNGEPAIIVSVEMSETSDIQPLGKALKERIQNFEDKQPIGITLHISTFQETNVTTAVNDAILNVAQTFVVVLVVMLLFLGLRPAGIIACIVPFTIMFALSTLSMLGVDIQQVSIAAVIISLGLLVDNGLVVVEDIDERIKDGMSAFEAARAAGGQYLVPLGVASITTISAFLPMLLIDGTEGEFAYSLGSVVAVMLLGSWITALYILPFLCACFLKPAGNTQKKKPEIIRIYGSLLKRLLPFGIPIIAATFALVAFSASQFSQLKSEMFPLSERSEVLVYMDMPKGTAISETEAYAKRVTDWLLDSEINPGVLNTTVFVGDGGPRFYLSLDPANPDPASAFFVVNMQGYEQALELAKRSRQHFIEQLPAARFRVTRLSMGGTESGLVDVEIFGPDAETLMETSRLIEAAIDELPGIVRNESDWGNKIIKIVVDIAQDKAREFGVTSKEISEVMDAYFSGTSYSTFRDGDEQIPIMLRAVTRERDSVEDLANLSVTAGGELISIDQIATFQPRLEFSEIRRENQERRIVITAKSELLSAAQLVERLQPTLDNLDLGPDYTIKIGGELENSAEAYTKIGSNLPLALGVMILALVFQFNSVRRTMITFLTIPIILVGAPFALLIAGQPMSFFAVLGLLSLMGIIINNAIVLINQIDIEAETKNLDDAIIEASQQRAKPIMLTSLTTIFGLFPMAFSGGPLFEPMATIMIGGLLVASPITLFFVPPVARLFLIRSAQSKAHKTEGQAVSA